MRSMRRWVTRPRARQSSAHLVPAEGEAWFEEASAIPRYITPASAAAAHCERPLAPRSRRLTKSDPEAAGTGVWFWPIAAHRGALPIWSLTGRSGHRVPGVIDGLGRE